MVFASSTDVRPEMPSSVSSSGSSTSSVGTGLAVTSRSFVTSGTAGGRCGCSGARGEGNGDSDIFWIYSLASAGNSILLSCLSWCWDGRKLWGLSCALSGDPPEPGPVWDWPWVEMLIAGPCDEPDVMGTDDERGGAAMARGMPHSGVSLPLALESTLELAAGLSPAPRIFLSRSLNALATASVFSPRCCSRDLYASRSPRTRSRFLIASPVRAPRFLEQPPQLPVLRAQLVPLAHCRLQRRVRRTVMLR